jgi:REP element-mobilizing transposase RayT
MVAATVRETCQAAGWSLYALNVRTNHVHVVVAAPLAPERVMTSLKAWCTRRLRENQLVAPGARPWTRHGSTRYLWTERDVDGACHYVIHEQGPALDSET